MFSRVAGREARKRGSARRHVDIGDIVIKAPTDVNNKPVLKRRTSKRSSHINNNRNNVIQVDETIAGNTSSGSDVDESEDFVDSHEHLNDDSKQSLSRSSNSSTENDGSTRNNLLSSSSRESSDNEVNENVNSSRAHNLRSSDFDLVITGEIRTPSRTATPKRNKKTKPRAVKSPKAKVKSSSTRSQSSRSRRRISVATPRKEDDVASKAAETVDMRNEKSIAGRLRVKTELVESLGSVANFEDENKSLEKSRRKRVIGTKRKRSGDITGKRTVKRQTRRKGFQKSNGNVEIIDLSDESGDETYRGIDLHSAVKEGPVNSNKKAQDDELEAQEHPNSKLDTTFIPGDEYTRMIYNESERRVKDFYGGKVAKAKATLPKKRGRKKKGELVEIRYRRMPSNKSKIITVDVIGQILSDYFSKRNIQKINFGENKHEKRLHKFVSLLRSDLDGYFDSLVDFQLSNDMLISEIDSYQRQKVQSRLGIFAAREERKQNSIQLNNLRHDYALLRRKYELRKEMCNNLIKLRGGNNVDGASDTSEADTLLGSVNFELSSIDENSTNGLDIFKKLHGVNLQIVRLLKDIKRE